MTATQLHNLPMWERATLGLFLLGLMVARSIVIWGKLSEKNERIWRQITDYLFLATFVVVFNLASQTWIPHVKNGVEWAMGKLGSQLTRIVVTVIVTGLGIGAYKFKGANQKWYGRVEVAVGICSAIIVAGTLGPNKLDLAKWSTLAGAAYVVQRGLGNNHDGKAKKLAPKTGGPAEAAKV